MSNRPLSRKRSLRFAQAQTQYDDHAKRQRNNGGHQECQHDMEDKAREQPQGEDAVKELQCLPSFHDDSAHERAIDEPESYQPGSGLVVAM